ncbi:putative aspartate aminotransferase [Lojkania enalia]|uniref:Aspartate aminotransferase n=1 Tax=Lojkania enalia TaxID=147567 RepID=A0A9P4K3T6_9PLEO|nr:putative aspartate aminotransferase [Didymosphaeria enalia]
MLSRRGQLNADQLDIPWRFAHSTTYDRDSNPEGLISFATAENILIQKELEDFANSRVHFPGASFGYGYSTAGGGPKFPSVLANHVNNYFNPYTPITGSDIKITSAATALHEILGFALADPGQGILTSRPVYGRFELDFGNKAGLKMVYADTYAESCFETGVVDKLEEALIRSHTEDVEIKALLIVNPNNPLGRCYPKPTLIALMKFCQKHQIHFISDEVYGLSVFDTDEPNAIPFTSALSIDPSGILDQNLLHVTYALSKDFGAPGLRLGALITKNEQLKKSLLGIIRFHSPSGASIAIATAMLTDGEWCRSFLSKSRQCIADAYKFTTSRLRRMGVRYLEGGNAGFFVYIDLSSYLPLESEGLSDREREFKLAQELVDAGIFLHPGEEHGLKLGWFRMVYTAVERQVLEEGLRR